MQIVYHYHKDKSKEALDIQNNWWTCPPELICTDKEEKQLTKLWYFFNGKNARIEDPLGHTQCLYIMLMELPWWFVNIFSKWNPNKIEKKHVYDID